MNSEILSKTCWAARTKHPSCDRLPVRAIPNRPGQSCEPSRIPMPEVRSTNVSLFSFRPFPFRFNNRRRLRAFLLGLRLRTKTAFELRYYGGFSWAETSPRPLCGENGDTQGEASTRPNNASTSKLWQPRGHILHSHSTASEDVTCPFPKLRFANN